jgi:hypothetical protein
MLAAAETASLVGFPKLDTETENDGPPFPGGRLRLD